VPVFRRPAPLLLAAALAAAPALAAPRAAAAQLRIVPRGALPIDWRVLGGLDVRTGAMSEALRQANGRAVRIPGFVVPLDDAQEEGAEFLLVPYYGACIHTPPPPPNQLVLVRMAGDKAVRLGLFEPVYLEGTLAVRTVESAYGAAGFEVRGTRVTPFRP